MDPFSLMVILRSAYYGGKIGGLLADSAPNRSIALIEGDQAIVAALYEEGVSVEDAVDWLGEATDRVSELETIKNRLTACLALATAIAIAALIT